MKPIVDYDVKNVKTKLAELAILSGMAPMSKTTDRGSHLFFSNTRQNLIIPEGDIPYELFAMNLVGVCKAVGVDIDALAVKTAKENGLVNNLTEPKYTVLQGNLTDKVEGKFDVVVANIVADVIIMFCKDVAQFLKDGGVFITSGIIDTRENDVLEAFKKYNFNVRARHTKGGWVCFEAEC